MTRTKYRAYIETLTNVDSVYSIESLPKDLKTDIDRLRNLRVKNLVENRDVGIQTRLNIGYANLTERLELYLNLNNKDGGKNE